MKLAKKVALSLASVGLAGAALSGCATDADTASHNLSKAAEQFEINRRVVFFKPESIIPDIDLKVE